MKIFITCFAAIDKFQKMFIDKKYPDFVNDKKAWTVE